MEEILASIKRIIAEDAPSLREAEREEEVLELGEAPATSTEGEGLVSGVAEAASRQAFAALSGVRIDSRAGTDTLDGLVRELLRPMLKTWLDANLPDIVERLVSREIARLGGR